MAAHEAGIETMDAYVIVPDHAVDLGMAKTAEKEGLRDITDIEIVDYARHPLMETTKRLQ
jgi:IMP dehydrogenase